MVYQPPLKVDGMAGDDGIAACAGLFFRFQHNCLFLPFFSLKIFVFLPCFLKLGEITSIAPVFL